MKITPPTNRLLTLLLVILSLLLASPNFLPLHLEPLPAGGHSWERFSIARARQQRTIGQLEQDIDAEAIHKGVHPHTRAYGEIVVHFVRERFYHGYSHYSFAENRIAALAGSLFWDHLSAVVLPEDLMRYPMAACSQQSIVMMELFRRKGIDYRKVGFDHHFALEGKFAGNWYFFDPDMEPDFSVVPRNAYQVLKENKELMLVYQNRIDSAGFRENMLGNQFYGPVNEPPAPNAAVFHQVTKVLSKVLWMFPLLLLAVLQHGRMRQRSFLKSGVSRVPV